MYNLKDDQIDINLFPKIDDFAIRKEKWGIVFYSIRHRYLMGIINGDFSVPMYLPYEYIDQGVQISLFDKTHYEYDVEGNSPIILDEHIVQNSEKWFNEEQKDYLTLFHKRRYVYIAEGDGWSSEPRTRFRVEYQQYINAWEKFMATYKNNG
jgi:hypothetical protein